MHNSFMEVDSLQFMNIFSTKSGNTPPAMVRVRWQHAFTYILLVNIRVDTKQLPALCSTERVHYSESLTAVRRITHAFSTVHSSTRSHKLELNKFTEVHDPICSPYLLRHAQKHFFLQANCIIWCFDSICTFQLPNQFLIGKKNKH